MSESTVPSIRPERTHTVTLPGTSNSGTIADVGTPDFSTGPRNRSTTSIWTGSTQHELTVNRLSGKLGAHHRATCEDARKGYVFAVPVNFTVTTPAGRKTAAALTRLVPKTAWETRSCGPGCKGHRDYEWAMVATSSPRHHVLIRRSICDPADLAFFYTHAPALVSLPILIKVAGKRWPVEECFQQGKGQTGLDQHQLRLWHSFHRHTVLSMCALALLTVATARPPGTVAPWATASSHISDRTTDQPGHWRDTGKLPARPGEAPPRDAGLIRITVPEARRLFALLTPPANQVGEIFRDAWSIWRRRHQARARWHHYQTRLQAAAA